MGLYLPWESLVESAESLVEGVAHNHAHRVAYTAVIQLQPAASREHCSWQRFDNIATALTPSVHERLPLETSATTV